MKNEKYRNQVLSEIAKILKEERLAKGLSMTVVAAEAGISQPMVGYIERRLRNPTLDTMFRITEVLDVDPATVIRRAQRRAEKK